MHFHSVVVSSKSNPLWFRQNSKNAQPARELILPLTMAEAPKRKEIEEALLNSAEWLRLARDASGLGLWYWNEITQNLHWDAKTREMFGAPPEGKVTLQMSFDLLHPDDRARVLKAWRNKFETHQPYDNEIRAVRPDGSVRWIHVRGMGHCDEARKPVFMVGVAFDVTERKAAEQQRAELSGRLINAQEQERRHLARELHDDFSQRLALLSNNLELVRRAMEESPIQAIERLQTLKEDASEIGRDLHALSHRLHSSKLELLGLARSIESCCQVFAKQEGIQVNFGHREVPKSIPSEIALCLFRIVQEGLRNVSKHSRASKVELQLTGSADEISLSLCDNGVGFEASSNSASNGIGIQSMNERARMVGGTFGLRSSHTEGTHIAVIVPLKKGGGQSATHAARTTTEIPYRKETVECSA